MKEERERRRGRGNRGKEGKEGRGKGEEEREERKERKGGRREGGKGGRGGGRKTTELLTQIPHIDTGLVYFTIHANHFLQLCITLYRRISNNLILAV